MIDTSSYSHHVLTGLQVLSENIFDELASISTDDGLRSQSGTFLQAHQEGTDTETVVQDQAINQSESAEDNNLSRAVSAAYHHHTSTNRNLE